MSKDDADLALLDAPAGQAPAASAMPAESAAQRQHPPTPTDVRAPMRPAPARPLLARPARHGRRTWLA